MPFPRSSIASRFFLAATIAAAPFVACGGSTAPESGGASTPPESAGPVDGVVIDPNSTPVVGMRLQIGDAVTQTDDLGRFHLDFAPALYDVVLAAPAPAPAILAYVGINTRTPTIHLEGYYGPAANDRHAVTLKFSNDGFPAGASLETLFDMPTAANAWFWIANDGSYTFAWTGDPKAKLVMDFFAQMREPTTMAPAHYVGYSHVERVLIAGAPTTTITPLLRDMPFGERRVTLHAALPAGAALFQTDALMRPRDGAPFFCSIGFSLAPGPDVSLVVPDMPGAALIFDVDAQTATGASSVTVDAPPSGDGALSIPPNPEQIAPDDGATNVDAHTEFRWSRRAGKIGFFRAYPSDASSQSAPLVMVFTAAESAHLPDASKLGVTLPSGTAYMWGAFATDSADSVDALARASRYPTVNPHIYTYSLDRTFTTK